MTEPEKVVIRRAAGDDAERVRRLRLDALRNHPQAFASDYESSQVEGIDFWRERIASQAEKGEGIIIVAEAGEKLVGMTGLYRGSRVRTRHSGTIWGVYVDPEWRGLRLGDVLVEAAVAWGREQGVVVAKLAVITTNIPAINSYLRCGFQVFGVEPKAILYNGTYYDELHMVRDIPAFQRTG